jgi:hypothetical protein
LKEEIQGNQGFNEEAKQHVYDEEVKHGLEEEVKSSHSKIQPVKQD